MYGMSWARYEGRALADSTMIGDALRAELENHIRVHNPHLTDIRVERVTATGEYDAHARPARRWYTVTYLADDGQGHQAGP